MAKFPQLPLWTDSYLADTSHLSTLEHGAYLLLLMTAWRSPGCALPNDEEMLARMARCPRHWHYVRAKVMAFWTLNPEDGKYYQKRLSKEYHKCIIRSDNASQSAGAKYLKNNKADGANAGFRHNQNAATTTTTRYINNSSKEETARAKALVHIKRDSKQWKACAARFKRERGKNPPQDDRFGWHFPADWPETKNTNEGKALQ